MDQYKNIHKVRTDSNIKFLYAGEKRVETFLPIDLHEEG
jgi:hypothetical protein